MGSWFSNPIKPQITQPSALDRVSCDEHVWGSKFGWESAIIYRALDTKPGICTICYSVSKRHDKVIYTFYDAFCDDNLVSVHIEFEAVRDAAGDGSYKFGLINTKDFSENFTQRRRRTMGPELLILSYVTGRRKNQLALLKRREGYEIIFASKSPLVVLHKNVHILCDPSRGLLAYVTSTTNGLYGEKLRYPHINAHDEAATDVMKKVNDIRSQLRDDAGSAISYGNNNTGPSLPVLQDGNLNCGNIILNAGSSPLINALYEARPDVMVNDIRRHFREYAGNAISYGNNTGTSLPFLQGSNYHSRNFTYNEERFAHGSLVA